MSERRIRVLIADDSGLARGMLRAILEREPDIEVVGEARDGQQAVELARELRPSLLTMDLEMPRMNGMEAIAAIMSTKAVPILVVSSLAHAREACDALRIGALDVIAKPDYSPEQAADFVARVRLLADIVVITRWPRQRPARDDSAGAEDSLDPGARSAAPARSMPDRAGTAAAGLPIPRSVETRGGPAPEPVGRFGPPPVPEAAAAVPPGSSCPRVFAIASSTGGPQALSRILPRLPADFPAPVLIAQHVTDGFAAGMADWLAGFCKLPVQLAEDGKPLRPGVVYLSPSECNLTLGADFRAILRERQPHEIYHPSCDLLLESVAEICGRRSVGIVLTGMGSDGAAGLARIRASGGITLAQDESSSVIYGMNRVAIEAGAAARVLPLEAIAGEMLRLTGQRAAEVAT